MEHVFRFPLWPMGPFFSAQTMTGFLAVAGLVFSIIMLIDCLKRNPGDFSSPLTKNGEYDKLIWALGIVLTFSFYFVGSIVYFFVVFRSRPKE